MDFYQEYRDKLCTPDEAVKIVKDGDWVDYGTNVGFPILLDEALSKRAGELTDVKIRGNLIFGPIKAVEADPERKHFTYNSWHMSAYERKLSDKGLCNFIPMLFRNISLFYREFLTVNVAMTCVAPMDKHGYFNLSCATGVEKSILEKADIVIVEVNENLPRVYGGFDESIHIGKVDYIVEGAHPPLPELPPAVPTPEEGKIAGYILPFIKDGANLQLGIGGTPEVIGKMLVQTDLKDLGMHTELCSDAYLELYEAGKLTNEKKKINRGKGMTGLAFGSKRLYEWLDQNPGVVFAPLEYINSPSTLVALEDIISINTCISADLYGQICAESSGLRQISGTGGQLDFVTGAFAARGGKAFLCMTSTFRDKAGVVHSRIVPSFKGDIVTDPRSQVHYIVTEYGAVNLAGMSTWQRAEMLISVAHPDFRDELIEAAKKQGIWRQSNKR